jgi:hypothetical protein
VNLLHNIILISSDMIPESISDRVFFFLFLVIQHFYRVMHLTESILCCGFFFPVPAFGLVDTTTSIDCMFLVRRSGKSVDIDGEHASNDSNCVVFLLRCSHTLYYWT